MRGGRLVFVCWLTSISSVHPDFLRFFSSFLPVSFFLSFVFLWCEREGGAVEKEGEEIPGVLEGEKKNSEEDVHEGVRLFPRGAKERRKKLEGARSESLGED